MGFIYTGSFTILSKYEAAERLGSLLLQGKAPEPTGEAWGKSPSTCTQEHSVPGITVLVHSDQPCVQPSLHQLTSRKIWYKNHFSKPWLTSLLKQYCMACLAILLLELESGILVLLMRTVPSY